MRTNVNLANDAREFAELYANAKGLSLGDAITVLIRNARKAAAGETKTVSFGKSASGFPTFPPKGRVITTEMVKKAEEDDLA
jgi:flagellar basal body L-ring protein FlgH